MTTKAQLKAQWVALIPTVSDVRLADLAQTREFHIKASEARLVQYAEYPPIVKRQKSDIAFDKSILRMIREEQKARKNAKVAA